jgi:UDP-glucose 4-epimerase
VLDAAEDETRAINIFGDDYNTPDGTCIRDYIHTMDLASAHYLAMEKLLNEDGYCEFVNLGTGNGFSVREIIQTAEKITGKKINSQIYPRRSGDPDKLIADISKAKSFLHWQPEYSNLDLILSTAWQWKRNNIDKHLKIKNS